MQGLDVNFKITEALKETTGSTWCGGSGYLLRRAAMDDIGGFPTESVGEDMYCSNVLLGKGWDAIYVDETLQSGRVPESYKAHVKQQGRWVGTPVQHAKGKIELTKAACRPDPDSHGYVFLPIRGQSQTNGAASTRHWPHLRDSIFVQYSHHRRHGHSTHRHLEYEVFDSLFKR